MKNLLPTLAAAVMPMLGGCDRCLTSVPCSGSTPALVVVGEVTLDGAPVDALITLFGTDSTELGHWQQWPDEYGPGFRSLGHAIGDVNVCQAGYSVRASAVSDVESWPWVHDPNQPNETRALTAATGACEPSRSQWIHRLDFDL